MYTLNLHVVNLNLRSRGHTQRENKDASRPAFVCASLSATKDTAQSDSGGSVKQDRLQPTRGQLRSYGYGKPATNVQISPNDF